MKMHRDAARPGDVGGVGVDEGVFAEEPGYNLIDQGMVEKVEELFALVGKHPDSLWRQKALA